MHSFSHALVLLKNGRCVARTGWNGRDMYLYLVPGSEFKVNRPPLSEMFPEGTHIQYHGHIDMKTAQGYCVPWVASQADLLSEDWIEVELVHETRIVPKYGAAAVGAGKLGDANAEELNPNTLGKSQFLR